MSGVPATGVRKDKRRGWHGRELDLAPRARSSPAGDKGSTRGTKAGEGEGEGGVLSPRVIKPRGSISSIIFSLD